MTLQPTISLSISSPSNSQQEKSFNQGDDTLVETHAAFYEKEEVLVGMMDKPYTNQSSPLSSAPPASRPGSQVMQPMDIETSLTPEPLPILPLLHYMAHNVSTTQKSRLLRLLLLSMDERALVLRKEPDLLDLLSWRSSQPPSDEYIEARINHLDYLALQLMLTAYKQQEERLSTKEQVQLGVDIGKLGLEMLTCLQIEAEKAAKTKTHLKFAPPTQTPSTSKLQIQQGGDDRRKFKKVQSGDISLGRAPPSPSPASPLTKNTKSNSPLSRRTSSSRFDLYETPGKKDLLRKVGSPLAEEKVDAKQVETSNLIKEIEGVLTTSVSKALPQSRPANSAEGLFGLPQIDAGAKNSSPVIRSGVLELTMLRSQLDVIQVSFSSDRLRAASC